MYYSIFPTQTTYISSGSHPDTGETMKDQNFGGSAVLELKKVFSIFKRSKTFYLIYKPTIRFCINICRCSF